MFSLLTNCHFGIVILEFHDYSPRLFRILRPNAMRSINILYINSHSQLIFANFTIRSTQFPSSCSLIPTNRRLYFLEYCSLSFDFNKADSDIFCTTKSFDSRPRTYSFLQNINSLSLRVQLYFHDYFSRNYTNCAQNFKNI